MPVALPAALRERSLLRYVLLTGLLVVLFGWLFDQRWNQVAVLTAVVFAAEEADLASALSMDRFVARFLLGLLSLAVALWTTIRGGSPTVAGVGTAVGGWFVLDALYSRRVSLDPSDDEPDLDAKKVLLTMQVGSLVTDELQSGPKTAAELAATCDLTESRVRDALELHERSGTVSRDGEQWVLEHSRIGPWPFVRDNIARLLRRLLRPFRLFVPA